MVAVALVLPVAYLTARHRSRAGGAANAVVVAGFALPGLVVALLLVFWVLRRPALPRSTRPPGLLISPTSSTSARRRCGPARSRSPRSPPVDDAARMLGAGRLRRLRDLELPLMRPGLPPGRAWCSSRR